MNWVPGSSHNSWQPVMTVDTTTSGYWLNWKVLVCSIWITASIAAASVLIWRYEGSRRSKDEEETRRITGGSLYEGEAWRACLKQIHPAWLLAYRVFAFVVLLSLLVVNAVVDGGSIFYFYTQWTFLLVTIYFGLGCFLSAYGCHHFLNKVGGERDEQTVLDTEPGTPLTVTPRENASRCEITKTSNHHQEYYPCQIAGVWSYVFQVMYQTCAGAVMLTDIVFWLVIFPFLTVRDYKLSFLLVGMHSINALFFLGDAALNCLRFPWFRVSYFILWTAIYVIFQWVIHACVSHWWPYPFLDLSSSHTPVWYLLLALLHIPCYAIYALLIKTKHLLYSKWFPHSYHYLK